MDTKTKKKIKEQHKENFRKIKGILMCLTPSDFLEIKLYSEKEMKQRVEAGIVPLRDYEDALEHGVVYGKKVLVKYGSLFLVDQSADLEYYPELDVKSITKIYPAEIHTLKDTYGFPAFNFYLCHDGSLIEEAFPDPISRQEAVSFARAILKKNGYVIKD